jgi:hypothetical protein
MTCDRLDCELENAFPEPFPALGKHFSITEVE